MGGVTFCRRIVKLLLKTFSSELKSNCWVGDFQVAIHGGFWVATRAKRAAMTIMMMSPAIPIWMISLNEIHTLITISVKLTYPKITFSSISHTILDSFKDGTDDTNRDWRKEEVIRRIEVIVTELRLYIEIYSAIIAVMAYRVVLMFQNI